MMSVINKVLLMWVCEEKKKKKTSREQEKPGFFSLVPGFTLKSLLHLQSQNITPYTV